MAFDDDEYRGEIYGRSVAQALSVHLCAPPFLNGRVNHER